MPFFMRLSIPAYLLSLEALDPVTERPRQVWIRVQPEAADTVRVAVADTGVGIAPAQLDQMFTAFYTTKAQGLGMGLAISRTIIEQHGGGCGRCRTRGRAPPCSLPCGRRPRRTEAGVLHQPLPLEPAATAHAHVCSPSAGKGGRRCLKGVDVLCSMSVSEAESPQHDRVAS
jgi:hypothetical protein